MAEIGMCVTWLIHEGSFVGSLSTRLFHISNVTHPYDPSNSVSLEWPGKTWRIYVCNVTCLDLWHDSYTCVTWLICTCVTWLIYTCDVDLFIRVTWRIDMRDVTSICVTWRIHTCDMIHAYAWCDSCKRMMWLVHKCDVTHPYMWHDSCKCMTWLFQTNHVTLSNVWRYSFKRVSSLIQTCDRDHLIALELGARIRKICSKNQVILVHNV